MPRHPRRAEESNYFHVIVQGIEKKYIFEKSIYKNKYYELIVTETEKFYVKIVAYCMMDNHAHFLMYTESIEALSKCMQQVNSRFAQYYNKREERVGYVFRDRFLSEPILTASQLYNCIAYIHFNPVKARIVINPAAYFYSSYNDYIRKMNIVDDKLIKFVFGTDNYMDLFKFIHFGYNDCMEFKETSNKIMLDNNLLKVNLLNENDIKKKCLELKEKGISNRKIATALNIGRNIVNKLMKN